MDDKGVRISVEGSWQPTKYIANREVVFIVTRRPSGDFSFSRAHLEVIPQTLATHRMLNIVLPMMDPTPTSLLVTKVPRIFVKSSGAEEEQAMKVAPATSLGISSSAEMKIYGTIEFEILENKRT